MTAHAVRVMWFVIGMISLAVGALGVFLPLLPTTPLVLVAAFAFAQSNERMHNWLVNHNIFGQLIADWRAYGAISRRAKLVSVISMGAVLIISALHNVPTSVLVVQAVVLSACAAFVVSRPLPPQQ